MLFSYFYFTSIRLGSASIKGKNLFFKKGKMILIVVIKNIFFIEKTSIK